MYKLYKYDDENEVPKQDFHSNSVGAATGTWDINGDRWQGAEFTFQEVIASSQKVFFRCSRV